MRVAFSTAPVIAFALGCSGGGQQGAGQPTSGNASSETTTRTDHGSPLETGVPAGESPAPSEPALPRPLSDDLPLEYDQESPVCRAAEVLYGAVNCIISESRHLHCWGVNADFAVGVRGGEPCGPDSGTVCVRDPVLVPGIDSVAKVATGAGATCAVREDGRVWCWGSNIAGLLGEGIDEICDAPGASNRYGELQNCSSDPVLIRGLERITDIDSWGSMCASEDGGGVYCWGWYGTTGPRPVLGATNAVAIEDGCALLADGGVACWSPESLTAQPIQWDGIATGMTLGYAMGCVIDEQASLHCWNLDTDWNSGIPRDEFDCLTGRSCTFAAKPFALEQPVAEASGSYEVMWIRSINGQVSAIVLGELQDPIDLPAPAIQISAGYDGACAVLEDKTVYCWTNPGMVNEFTGYTNEPTQIELCRELE